MTRRNLLPWYCTVTLLYNAALTGTLLIVPLWAKHLGASPAELGLISAAHAAHQIVLRVPSGLLADRIGELTMLRVGLIHMSGAVVLLAAGGGMAMLFISQVLSGLSRSLFWTSADVYASRLEQRTPGAIGFYRSAGSLGAIVAPVLVAIIISRYAFPMAGGVLVAMIAATLATAAVLPPFPRAVASSRITGRTSVWTLLRAPGMPTASTAAVLTAAVLAVSTTFFPVHFLEQGIPLVIIGFVMSGRAVAQTITSALVARVLSARWRPLFALACLVAGVAFAGAVFARTVPAAVAVAAGAGICQGITHPLATYLTSIQTQEQRGLAMGINGTFFTGGLMGGPAAFGLLAQVLSVPTAFAVFGLAVAGVAITPVLRRNATYVRTAPAT
jgi:MFS family permease